MWKYKLQVFDDKKRIDCLTRVCGNAIRRLKDANDRQMQMTKWAARTRRSCVAANDAWHCATFHQSAPGCPWIRPHTAQFINGPAGRWWKAYRLSVLIVHGSASEPRRRSSFISHTILTYCRRRDWSVELAVHCGPSHARIWRIRIWHIALLTVPCDRRMAYIL